MGDSFEHQEILGLMMRSVVNNVERHTVTLAENHRDLGLAEIHEEDEDISSSSSEDMLEAESDDAKPLSPAAKEEAKIIK